MEANDRAVSNLPQKLNIKTPTLIIDERKCRSNIAAMVDKAGASGVLFRPHFKTHQSLHVGKWFPPHAVNGISVSSLKMASYFAKNGYDDITVCVPVNVLQISKINALAKAVTLNCLVESTYASQKLTEELDTPIGVFIEIDCGYPRTGVPSDATGLIDDLLSILQSSSNTKFKGFLSHAGHSYHAESTDAIKEIHASAISQMKALKDRYIPQYPDIVTSLGDTPCFSVVSDFSGADEARPGNFVFYDLTQVYLGSCTYCQVAVAMACPVIATYPARGELVIHGGSVHLGKESLVTPDGSVTFGEIVEFNESGWNETVPDVRIKSLSQEHGVITAPRSFVEKVQIGDILGVLPVHSCITADTAQGYVTTKGQILDHMKGCF